MHEQELKDLEREMEDCEKRISTKQRRKAISLRLAPDIIDWLHEQEESQSRIVEKLIREKYGLPIPTITTWRNVAQKENQKLYEMTNPLKKQIGVSLSNEVIDYLDNLLFPRSFTIERVLRKEFKLD